jgi:hypothetical protein
MKLAGFNILDVIYSVDETVVARAEAANGNQLVLKYQNTSHPSLDLIARWRHEHDILQGISSEWVIKSYGLQQVDAIQVLLLEYFSSSNLAQLLEQRQLTLAERLLGGDPAGDSAERCAQVRPGAWRYRRQKRVD